MFIKYSKNCHKNETSGDICKISYDADVFVVVVIIIDCWCCTVWVTTCFNEQEIPNELFTQGLHNFL